MWYLHAGVPQFSVQVYEWQAAILLCVVEQCCTYSPSAALVPVMKMLTSSQEQERAVRPLFYGLSFFFLGRRWGK